MRRIRMVGLAIVIALGAGLGVSAPADATECTPRGCTGGCRPGSVNVDPETLTIDAEPIECYS